MQRSRGAVITAGAVVVVVVVVIAVLALITRSTGDNPTGDQASQAPLPGSSSAANPFDDLRATAIAEALASGESGRVAAVIATAPSVTLDAGLSASLKQLAPIDFDVPSTRYLDDDTGYVQATAGPSRVPWIVYLVRQNGQWVLASSQQGTIS